jgi:alcohol dehydrogenase (cytochrome c)
MNDAQAFVPVTQSILANPDPADWLMINRTFDEQRFSPLDQINKTNVGQLRMAWSRGLPNGTQESTPIVYRGVMYLYAPGASIQAVDATNGDLIWEYTRNYPRDLSATAARNKSLGIFEDMIYTTKILKRKSIRSRSLLAMFGGRSYRLVAFFVRSS